ncbi:uncharacterized protein LOC126381071 [Pectinophora gossypiella]|uniref:uncharacterized protein LOC126370938 n=1 Tax=Pectinophora gossypiella TaxID=13191 RepID=UPI00214E0CC1|nr:uncharacterized protein LOC126370938 [Pectinophora gossypiella]XP_049886570.1 uncharacterized protein LOC126381071 [Pectinophora gossypiella]
MDSVLSPPKAFYFDENALDLSTGALSECWSKWKRSYDIYVKACEINKKPAEIQLNILLHIVGGQCCEILDQFPKCTTPEQVITRLDEYFQRKKNVTVERHRFFKRQQKENETIEQYVFELRKLSLTCEFGALREELIKDRLVCGVTDAAICERLLREDNLNLRKALEICQAAIVSRAYSESIKMDYKSEVNNINSEQNYDEEKDQIFMIRRGAMITRGRRSSWRGGRGRGAAAGRGERAQPAAAAVAGPSHAPPYHTARWPGPRAPSTRARHTAYVTQCGHCGGVHRKHECPAYGKTCMRCSKMNHFARVCGVYQIEESEEQGIGCLPGKHTIHLKDNAVPVVHAPRKMPFAIKDDVKKTLDKLEAQEIIKKVHSGLAHLMQHQAFGMSD